METLNLKINENFSDWGIQITSKQKIIVLNDTATHYDVYKIPLECLVYNPSNGRMFMEAKRYENEQNKTLVSLKDEDPETYNDEVENMIWSTNENKNISTKNDIENYGQMEPGVVLDDGIVIDGNRRFTCLRRLHRENPEDERFKYFLAAIIKVDGQNITKKLLKEYELRVQFGTDEKVTYNAINKNMSIYDLIKNDGFDYTTVAHLLGNGTTASDVMKICRTCSLVDEFLDYIGKPGAYQIAEDLKIYWPLEPLSQYLNNNDKVLSSLEKNERKHLFFDYLLTLDVSLITQNLRDGLIKKIFKDKKETEELIEKHNEGIGNNIAEVISETETAEDFSDKIKELRNSDKASEDTENYLNSLAKQISKNQIDVPLKECKNAKKCLENVNVQPLVDASNSISNKKLGDINNLLDEILETVEKIKNQIKK